MLLNNIMDSVNKVMKTVSSSLGPSEKFLKKLLKGPYVYGVIVLIIGIYGPRLSPRLPSEVRNLFNNAYFRFVILTLVIYLSNKNLYLAMTVSITFVLLLNLANSLEVEEHFVKKYAENFSEIGPVLTEGFEVEDKKKEASVAPEAEPKAAPVEPSADDFGNASYRKGYTDGQDAQCPIGNTGGVAYSDLEKAKDGEISETK